MLIIYSQIQSNDIKLPSCSSQCLGLYLEKCIPFLNLFEPEFTIVANCCRNSRLVVDEDDLMWFKNLRKLPRIGKPVSWKFSFSNPLLY